MVIETEVVPAPSVETDARIRLGEQIRKTGRTILSSVAVRLPERFRTKSGAALRSEVAAAQDLEMALHTGRGSIGIIPLKDLPVLDVTQLSSDQLAAAVKLFEDFATKDLRPINEAR